MRILQFTLLFPFSWLGNGVKGRRMDEGHTPRLSDKNRATSLSQAYRSTLILSHHVPSTFTLFRRGRLPGIQLELVSSILRYPTSPPLTLSSAGHETGRYRRE